MSILDQIDENDFQREKSEVCRESVREDRQMRESWQPCNL